MGHKQWVMSYGPDRSMGHHGSLDLTHCLLWSPAVYLKCWI